MVKVMGTCCVILARDARAVVLGLSGFYVRK